MKDIVHEIFNDPTFTEGVGWKKLYFQANEILFRGGEPSQSLFLLKKVRYVSLLKWNWKITKTGELFGETCFLESGKRNASVIAITDGCAVEIDVEILNVCLDANPVKGHLFFKKLLLTMFERLQQDNRRIKDFCWLGGLKQMI